MAGTCTVAAEVVSSDPCPPRVTTAKPGAQGQDPGRGVLGLEPRVEPGGILVAELNDVGQRNQVFKDGACLGLAAQKRRPDVGIVRHQALPVCLLQECS